jgi:DNA topoisomerase IA
MQQEQEAQQARQVADSMVGAIIERSVSAK